jgi:hypothetical protein
MQLEFVNASSQTLSMGILDEGIWQHSETKQLFQYQDGSCAVHSSTCQTDTADAMQTSQLVPSQKYPFFE